VPVVACRRNMKQDPAARRAADGSGNVMHGDDRGRGHQCASARPRRNHQRAMWKSQGGSQQCPPCTVQYTWAGRLECGRMRRQRRSRDGVELELALDANTHDASREGQGHGTGPELCAVLCCAALCAVLCCAVLCWRASLLISSKEQLDQTTTKTTATTILGLGNCPLFVFFFFVFCFSGARVVCKCFLLVVTCRYKF